MQPIYKWVSIGPKNSHCYSVLLWNAPPPLACDVQRAHPFPAHQPLELLLDSLTEFRCKICLQVMEDNLIPCRVFILRGRVIATAKRLKKGEVHNGDTLNVSANLPRATLKGNIQAQHSKGTAFHEIWIACRFHGQIWGIQSHPVHV